MATDQAASLRDAFRDLMIGLTGTPLVGDGALWWVDRLCVDVGSGRFPAADRHAFQPARHRPSGRPRPCAQALAVAGRLGCILPQSGNRQVMSLAGAEMAGNLLLLAAMTFYARYVLLDAEGLLPRREPRAGRRIDRGGGGRRRSSPPRLPATGGGRSTRRTPRRSRRFSGPRLRPRRPCHPPVPPPSHPPSIAS